MSTLENPVLIYEAPHMPWLDRQPAPLILLHDGGGTTVNYHCLYSIGRTLYGIENSRLHEGGHWDGGLPVMAAHYIELLERAFPAGGDILLGGWSLGGLLALEMCWQLANRPAHSTRPKLKVIGLVFIDTVYVGWIDKVPDARALAAKRPIVKSPATLAAMSLQDKVTLSMIHCQMMVSRWKMPNWAGRESEIPPAILLRAKERVKEPGREFIDYLRESRSLGWNMYHRASWLKQITELDGNHFTIFSDRNLKILTSKIAAAADALDFQQDSD